MACDVACDGLRVSGHTADLGRVWCVFELAWWLKHKEAAPIELVPVHAYAQLASLYLRLWPPFMFFVACCFGAATWHAIFFQAEYLAGGHGFEERACFQPMPLT